MPKSLTKTNNGYRILVKRVQDELSELDYFVKRRTAESYWRVGKFIHEHLLANKDRADYGSKLFKRLAEDVNRDETTLLRSVRFYRTYPILARGQELTWSHYRTLITIKDKDKRMKLEKQIALKDWDAQRLQEYLNTQRELKTQGDNDKSIFRLKFTRGRLNICRVIKEDNRGAAHFLDLGFRMRRALLGAQSSHLKDGDYVEFTSQNNEWPTHKTEVAKDELFTYKAHIDKVIDGDTLWVTIDAGFGIFIEQKLRLRGIDCPEIDTDEGRRAKKFVQSRLAALDFIVVKTHKDSSDKYDRYLADIFYSPEESDPGHVAQEGKFLNQELLDERLAYAYA